MCVCFHGQTSYRPVTQSSEDRTSSPTAPLLLSDNPHSTQPLHLVSDMELQIKLCIPLCVFMVLWLHVDSGVWRLIIIIYVRQLRIKKTDSASLTFA